MNTTPFTVRGCSPELRRALKQSARSNHRSLNGEALVRLERHEADKQSVTCAQAAEILRRADKLLNREDREQIVAGIEVARRRMKHEHLR